MREMDYLTASLITPHDFKTLFVTSVMSTSGACFEVREYLKQIMFITKKNKIQLKHLMKTYDMLFPKSLKFLSLLALSLSFRLSPLGSLLILILSKIELSPFNILESID